MDIQQVNDKLPIVGEVVDLPINSSFSDGVYLRTIFMPRGSIVVGKKHKTKHFNIVHTGSADVWVNDKHMVIKAPYIFESEEDVRKILYIHEDMYWSTVHATDLKDENEIEKLIIEEDNIDVLESINNELKLLLLEEIK